MQQLLSTLEFHEKKLIIIEFHCQCPQNLKNNIDSNQIKMDYSITSFRGKNFIIFNFVFTFVDTDNENRE